MIKMPHRVVLEIQLILLKQEVLKEKLSYNIQVEYQHFHPNFLN